MSVVDALSVCLPSDRHIVLKGRLYAKESMAKVDIKLTTDYVLPVCSKKLHKQSFLVRSLFDCV